MVPASRHVKLIHEQYLPMKRLFRRRLPRTQIVSAHLRVVQVRMHYYEWWSRALKPGIHFVEVDEGAAMCDDIVRKVSYRLQRTAGSCHSVCISAWRVVAVKVSLYVPGRSRSWTT